MLTLSGADDEKLRDCHAAVEFYVVGETSPRRAYGTVQFFFYLPLQGSTAMICIAYVEWFKMEKGNEYLYRQPLARDQIAHRAVPVSEFVCKFALLPVQQRKTKYAKVELL